MVTLVIRGIARYQSESDVVFPSQAREITKARTGIHQIWSTLRFGACLILKANSSFKLNMIIFLDTTTRQLALF